MLPMNCLHIEAMHEHNLTNSRSETQIIFQWKITSAASGSIATTGNEANLGIGKGEKCPMTAFHFCSTIMLHNLIANSGCFLPYRFGQSSFAQGYGGQGNEKAPLY